MLLDRIDIDAHGPLFRVELGPLGEGLNVVFAPEGAGKTAVVRFIRDSLVAREYPLGMMNSSTGRVVWADRHGLIHCRREQDGTSRGRRTIEFESRGEYPLRFDSLDRSWIRGAADTTDASLALRSMRVPESIADGVITDTAVTHVARVVAACLGLGLGQPDARPAASSDGDRVASGDDDPTRPARRDDRLRTELAEVVAELGTVSDSEDDRRGLNARRATLLERLDRGPEGEAIAAGDSALGWVDREAIVGELRRIDRRLATLAHTETLRRRKARLEELLGGSEMTPGKVAPLARDASRWLVRLSAGRLRRLEWNEAATDSWRSGGGDAAPFSPSPAESRRVLGVRIDGHDESACAAADRALASLAVRMAAADLLARSGRSVPLVVELHREQFPEAAASPAFGQDPLVSAMADYVASGRQLVVLTSSPAIAESLTRGGGRGFQLHADATVHPHRPMWKSQFRTESYVGPHPHLHRPPHERVSQTGSPELAGVARINRDFDTAWRDAYGIDDGPAAFRVPSPSRPAGDGRATDNAARVDNAALAGIGSLAGDGSLADTDRPEPGTAYRDGVYYGHRFTTRRDVSTELEESSRLGAFDATPEAVSRGACRSGGASDSPGDRVAPGFGFASADSIDGGRSEPAWRSGRAGQSDPSVEGSPFFLTVDSPIDQAPSIDAVLAARLRGLGITHVIHLMREDSNRLADTLGVANINASSIRRWQSECRLVCRVPQLRGFDARILVGCGISEPASLAAMPPMELLERVEAFLATERGQRILLSGTSYELCRITSWIASANRSSADRSSADRSAGGTTTSGIVGLQIGGRTTAEGRKLGGSRGPQRFRSRNGATRPAEARPAAARGRRGEDRVSLRLGADRDRDPVRSGFTVAAATPEDDRLVGPPDAKTHVDDGEAARYFLDRECPIEELPGIGPRMAERLVEVGVGWIEDLLRADPQSLAETLGHRRVDAAVVCRWQHVASLLCRVPGLEGFEARLLVKADITTPETLAAQDAEQVLAAIGPIVRGQDGRRILRGRPAPGIEQAADWVASAARVGSLQAA